MAPKRKTDLGTWAWTNGRSLRLVPSGVHLYLELHGTAQRQKMRVCADPAQRVEAAVKWLHTEDDPFVPQELLGFVGKLEGWHMEGQQASPGVSPFEMRSLEEMTTPVVGPRSRESPEHFIHSVDSQRSDHDAQRRGERHVRVRDTTYAEATQQLEEQGLQSEVWLHEVRKIITQADVVLSDVPDHHAHAARALQEALI